MAKINDKEIIFVSSDGKKVAIIVMVKVKIKKEENGFSCYCPSLKISSQGDNLGEAKKNIAEAADLFIESCVARGVLSATLLDRGFNKKQRRCESSAKNSNNNKTERIIEIPVALPLAA